jgi:MFS family permease
MPTGYRKNQESIDPLWTLLCGLFVIALCVIALPAIILGFIAQHYLEKHLHWRWSFAIWFVPALLCILFLWSQQDLQSAAVQCVLAYIQAIKHFQYDLVHYPLRDLWANTWPLWLRTFVIGVFLSGFWFELISNMRTNTASHILRGEKGRQRRIARTGERARKRTRRPIPDTAGNAMVMGVPIKDEEKE